MRLHPATEVQQSHCVALLLGSCCWLYHLEQLPWLGGSGAHAWTAALGSVVSHRVVPRNAWVTWVEVLDHPVRSHHCRHHHHHHLHGGGDDVVLVECVAVCSFQ